MEKRCGNGVNSRKNATFAEAHLWELRSMTLDFLDSFPGLAWIAQGFSKGICELRNQQQRQV
jgi:hypothetical protein